MHPLRRPARLAAAATAALSLALPGFAAAKDKDHDRAAAFQSVLDCRSVTDNTQRLACYDAAASRMGEAEAKGDIVVIDKAQAREAHREAFGLSLPSLDFISRALNSGEMDQLQGVVKSARADAYGHWTVVLEDGAVWRQIAGELNRDPHAGSKVVINKAALGSFKMSVDGQANIKVHRDE
ncbi:MAG: hypothetical protein E7812_02635 [Phenylobacterium sp.]|nr:MAG: hypothetical protein E7812_02635 [Phenylobacterium sp.]